MTDAVSITNAASSFASSAGSKPGVNTSRIMQDSEDMDDNASQGEGGNNDSGEQEAIVVAGGGEAAAASGDAAGAGSSTALAMISAARPPGSMSVTSDEVNYLIFRYLQECGFVHSSFTFAHESMLGRTGFRNADRTLPPGALVTFLQKGLQYVTMEERLVMGGGRGAGDEEEVSASDNNNAMIPAEVSLLSPYTLGAISRSNPVIQLNVPPASAAAALKARLEAEAKLSAAEQQQQQQLRQQHQQQQYQQSQASSLVSRAGSSGNINGALLGAGGAAATAAANMGVLSGAAAALLDPASAEAAAAAAAGGGSSGSGGSLEAELLAAASGGRDGGLHSAVLAQQALAAQAAAAQAAAAAAAMNQFQQQIFVQQQQHQQQQQQTPQGVLPTHVMDHPLFQQQLQKQAELLVLQQQAALGARLSGSIAESNDPEMLSGNNRRKAKRAKHGDDSNALERFGGPPGSAAVQRLPQHNEREEGEDDEEGEGSGRESDNSGGGGDDEANDSANAENDSEMDADGGDHQVGLTHPQHLAAAAVVGGGDQPPSHGALGGRSDSAIAGDRQLVNGEYDRNGEQLVTSGPGKDPYHRNGAGRSDEEPSPLPEQSSGAQLPEVDDSATAASPDEILQLHMHESEVFMCAWNPVFTQLIATGSGDASARIWEMNGGTAKAGISTVKTLPHGSDPKDKKNKDVTTLEWSFDGQYLATGSYDGVARVWARSGALLHTLRRHTGPIFSLKWNRNGNYILSGSYDTTAIVWDVSEPKADQVVQQFTDHEAPTLDVDWRDNRTFATCSTDKKVHIYMVGVQKPLKVYRGHNDEVNAVKWDPSGRYLASCSDDCTAKVWEVDNDRPGPLYAFTSHTQEIYTVKWSPTGVGSANPDMLSLLATASFDGTVRLWNVLDGTCFRIFDRHRDSVYSVAFSPSGRYLASGSLAGQLYIWHVERGEQVKSFKGTGDIFEVAWNKEETMVAACFSSNVVAIMDFDRWQAQ